MVKMHLAPTFELTKVSAENWLSKYIQPTDEIVEKVLKAAELAARRPSNLTPNLTLHALSSMTADILMILKPDINTILLALMSHPLLHGQISVEEVRAELGDDCAKLASDLISLHEHSEKAHNVPGAHADKLRRLLLTVIEDVRVVLVRLGMQCALLRHFTKMAPPEQYRLAQETRQIYAPLANRLGVGQFKWELEDYAFRILEPAAYKHIARLLDEKRGDREEYIAKVKAELEQALAKAGIQADVLGRPKHIWSIWRKMLRKGVHFNEIYDVRALRVLTKDVTDCYGALGIVHGLWQHIPQEFDDYIASPKENGYRSLHTAVYGPSGKTVEVQIRTKQMHNEAECGVAAHWMYKEGKKSQENFRFASLRQILDWQDELAGSFDDLNDLGTEVLDEQIYVFTPNGEVVELCKDATPIDFAFHIHSDLGFGCRGAKVNGAMVALNKPLKSGDQVEVIANKGAAPSRDWLNNDLGYLRSSKARAKVLAYFRKQTAESAIKNGKALLEKELKRFSITDSHVNVAKKCHMKDVNELYIKLNNSEIKPSTVISRLHDEHKAADEAPSLTQTASGEGAVIEGIGKDTLCHFAGCCKPVPGDPIMGYITRGRGITIHRQDCLQALSSIDEDDVRLIRVNWGSGQSTTFPVDITITVFDRTDMLKDITGVLSAEKINLSSIRSATDKSDNSAIFHLTIDITDIESMRRLMAKLESLPNVLEVYRSKG